MARKLPRIDLQRGAREATRGLPTGMRLGLVALFALAALGGCGGGGGGGTSSPVSGAPSEGLTVSGTVRNLSAPEAARAARMDLSAVDNAQVWVSVDLDEDGSFDPKTEVFTARTDTNGGFAVPLPAEAKGKTVELRVEKPGYSSFVQRYEGVEGPILMDPVLSEGAVAAVDLGGVSATPKRAGRIVLDTDRTVTVSLVRDRATGRRAARVFWGAEPAPSSGEGQELARMSFSLRGLELAAGTERLYASVAYLDTVNDPDTMPGGFRAEGSGESPVDILTTYAASEITLYDELGNKLLTDPTDRSRDIRIRIAIPEEAYDTLVDEDPDTPEVEIPLFYYDEAAGTWRMHRASDGSPAYGHLEDAFGNVLTQEDLARIAAGEDTETQVFGVGTVNHFSTWNCDKSWTSVSYHARFRDRDGNPLNGVSVRIRTRNGGWASDYSRRSDANLHTYRANADSIIKRTLDRNLTPEERSRLLYAVMNAKSPEALTALVEALRRYEEQQMTDIASEENELKRGFAAIFRHKEITDAFINTEGLDCAKTPDLCKGAIAAAAEAVNRSSKAKQATAFLMQIAVDAYDPSNLNFEYAATKGLEFLDIVANTDGVAKDLGDIPGQIRSAKDLASKALAAYRAYKGGTGSWKAYWDLAKQLRDTMENIKSLATTLGGRLNRRAPRPASLTPPDPQTPDEEAAAVDDITEEVLSSYDEVGGLLFGYSRMRRYQWGYFDAAGEFHAVEDWPGKPDYVGGGAAVMLEYYDGTDWVPLEGRSDLGVDASFIAVPSVTSFGPGSPQAPAVYLGTWTLDLQPNVRVTGKVVSSGGAPLADVPIVVAGTELRSGPDGSISGEITWFSDSAYVPYQLPAFWVRSYAQVQDGTVDLGEIEVTDQITLDYGSIPWWTPLKRGESVTVRPADWSGTVSGRALSYTYALYEGWVSDEKVPVQEGSGESFSFTVGPDTAFGRYTLRITMKVPEDDSVNPQFLDLGIDVQSTAPEITTLALDSQQVEAGTPVRVTLEATDADGPGDIRSKNVWTSCYDEEGVGYWMSPRLEPDGTWSISTNTAYPLLEGSVRCTVTAAVTDNSGRTDRKALELEVLPNPVPPQVAGGGLDDEYVVSLGRVYQDGEWADGVEVSFGGRVWFQDLNRDLERFELDCGNGTDPAVAGGTWALPPCRYTAPGDYPVTYKAVDSTGLETALQTTVHVLHPLRIEVAVPDDVLSGGGDDGETVVNLPAADQASVDVTVRVVSDNGPDGYEEGGGTIEEGTYSIMYRSGNRWWWSESLASRQPLPEDGAVPLTLDRPGSYTVYVWAQDARGMSASFSRVIEVTAPFDGELAVNGLGVDEFARAGGWVEVGDDVEFAVEDLTAPEDADMRYRWFVDDVDQGETTDPTFTYAPDSEGEHTVRVEIRNAQETQEAHKVVREVTFQAYSPVPVTLSRVDEASDGGSVRVGDVVTVAASVPEGVEAAAVRWSVDGPTEGFRPVPTEEPLQASWTFAEAGSYTIRVAVEDERGVTSTQSFGPFEVTAEPPAIRSLSADPTSGRPPLTVTFAVDAEDPDARPGEVLRYRWFVDGEPSEAGTEASFTHTFTTEASHTVRVEVADAGGLTATASVTVVVQDRPPSIASVRVEPGSGIAPLDVTATAAATDDGEVAGYAWYLDGEALGTGPTLTHTFDTPGTYTLKVTVTDDAGQTSSDEVTVYVLDPDAAGIVFQFKEARSDGLGPLVDFDALSDVLSHGGGLWFASTPLDDATVGSEDLQGLSSQLTFAGPAFYGFHGESWGNVSDTLVQIDAAGTYEVAVNSWETASQRAVGFPAAYSCGLLLYGEWPRTFGYWGSNVDSPLSSLDIDPSWLFTTADGRVNLLAMLGQWNDATYTCDYEYFGFKSSGDDAFSLGETEAVPLRALEIASPAGIQAELSDVVILLDGMEFRFGETHQLPQDAQGRVQIPVVPGADYVLEFAAVLDDGSYWTVQVPLDADTVAASDPVAVDLLGLDQESPLGLENAPAGFLGAEIVGASGIRLRSRQSVSEGATATGSVLTVQDESTVHLMFDGTEQGDGFGFYRTWAPDALPDPLDLSAPGASVEVSGPEIAVDTENETVTVRYQATGADACVVDVDVEFDTNGDGWGDRSRWENFLTDGSVTEFTIRYPLPEMTVTFGEGTDVYTETYPATDAVSKVTARVNCLKLSGGYDAFVREMLLDDVTLDEASFYGWPPESLAELPAVEEMVWEQTSWVPSP
ncbi:MAG: PKD domain-containing protein [Deltaproteobacteria bacterium]|nr:PKD domain-containing protein [Deltaproteobacteria bacterium]